MTPDPKDELGARFDDRRPDSEDGNNQLEDNTDNTDNSDNSSNTNSTSNPGNTGETGSSEEDTDNPDSSGDTDDSDNSDNPNNTDSDSKPGPSRSEDATRHRRQVPMYLSDDKAEMINSLYERLDGRSKVVGGGGIEKHADFMEELVEFAAENEEELAERLGIDLT